MLLERSRVAATQNDVELVAERPFRLGHVEVETRNQPLAGTLIWNGLEDRIVCHQRIIGKIHLRDQTRDQTRPKQRKMDVRRTPGIRVVAPRIGARLDGDEPVVPFVIGARAAGASEVRVERRGVAILFMNIAPGGVALPEFDQRAWNGTSVFVENASGDDDPLAKGLARVLACEVVVGLADWVMSVERPCPFG